MKAHHASLLLYKMLTRKYLGGDIIGTRNRMIHEYNRVNMGILWTIIKQDVPRLLPQLRALLETEE